MPASARFPCLKLGQRLEPVKTIHPRQFPMSATAATPWRYGNLVAAIATITVAYCAWLHLSISCPFSWKCSTYGLDHWPQRCMGTIGILLAGPFFPRSSGPRRRPKRVAYVASCYMASRLHSRHFPVYIWFPLRFAVACNGCAFTISEAWILNLGRPGSAAASWCLQASWQSRFRLAHLCCPLRARKAGCHGLLE